MSLDLTVSLHDESAPDDLDHLTRQLRDELVALEVESVRAASDATTPTGAKGEPITVGSLIVSLASAGVFTAVIELLKSWALRREGRKVTLKAKAGDRAIELTYCPAETSPRAMAQFAENVLTALAAKPKKA